MAYISTGAFADGCMVSFDTARRELVFTMATGGTMTMHDLPARPIAASAFAVPEVPRHPVTKQATVQKLGYKKMPVLGSEIWNQRYIRLEADHITYHVDESHAPKGNVHLVSGCKVRVVQAEERSRKDKHEDQGNSMVGMMTNPMGSMFDEYCEPIGKPNCVELYVPAKIGAMMDTMMTTSPMGMAFGGGADTIKNSVARTFYFSFSDLRAANDFAAALQNNIDVVVKNTPATPVGSSAGAGMQGLVNMAQAMQANQALAQKVRSTARKTFIIPHTAHTTHIPHVTHLSYIGRDLA